MSASVVRDFNLKSADKRVKKSLPSVKKTLKQCLLDLKQYVDQIIEEYLDSTTYDSKEISDWIYKDNVDSTNPVEIEEYTKANLFAARQTFNNILIQIEAMPGRLNYHNIKLYRNLILDFLHDIGPFLEHYKRRGDSSYVFLKGYKDYFTGSFETFMMARNFFYNSLFKESKLPYKESQGMVAMTIRQSIEIKTKRIFGINKIRKVRNRAPDYGFKRIFKFIQDNVADITYDPIDFEVLKNIYRWSCAYIHNGEGSYLWQTETALSYLKNYFRPGTHSTDGRTTWSAFGAFRIRNFDSLKIRLDAFVGSDYQIEYLPDKQIEAIIEST